MGGNRTPIVDDDNLYLGKESFVVRYHAHLMRFGVPYEGDAPCCLRRMTVTEAKLIQGFPRDYKMTGAISSQYRQIGNAVPPPLSEAVARCVASYISTRAVA